MKIVSPAIPSREQKSKSYQKIPARRKIEKVSPINPSVRQKSTQKFPAGRKIEIVHQTIGLKLNQKFPARRKIEIVHLANPTGRKIEIVNPA